MSLREEKSAKKSRPNYITAVISITLVLLNLGILGAALLMSRDLPNSVKENLEFQLELNADLSEEVVNQYAETLRKEPFVKTVEYVSKDQAAALMQKELGEDFKGLLGYNPLYASLNLKLKSEFLVIDKVKEIEANILKSGYVKSVNYDADLLFLIALFLIDSTIRLSMYSKRFLIRSMKLVGATEWFISKPFVRNGIFIGAVSGVIASVILISVIFPLAKFFFNVSILDNAVGYVLLIIFLILTGVLISVLSTLRSVKKYLKLKLNELY